MVADGRRRVKEALAAAKDKGGSENVSQARAAAIAELRELLHA
jgi:hypothetical protein